MAEDKQPGAEEWLNALKKPGQKQSAQSAYPLPTTPLETPSADTPAGSKPTETPRMKKLVRRKVGVKPERIGCTSCGAPIEIKCPAMAEMITCGSCGAVLDLESEDKRVLRKITLEKGPTTPIKPGDKGNIKGTAWDVIGRLHLKDAEGYSWWEFLLFSPKSGFAWLQLDEGHWTFYRKSKEKPTINPLTSREKQAFSHLGMKFKVHSKSSATITYVEGEFPYQANAGDISWYAEAICPPFCLSAEWTETESEWLLGEYIPPRALQQGFKLKEPTRPRGVAPCQPFETSAGKKQLALTLAAFTIVFLFLSIFTLGCGKHKTSFDISADQYLAGSENAPGYISDFIEFEKPTIIQLKLNAPVQNSWIYLDMEVQNEQGKPVHFLGRQISYYRGSDWSEGSQRSGAVFRISDPGKYRLAVSGQGGRDNTNNPGRETVNIKVYSGVMLQRYFIIAALLCLIFPVYQWGRRGKMEAERWELFDD